MKRLLLMLLLPGGGHVQADDLAVNVCAAYLSSGARGRVQVLRSLQARAVSGGSLLVAGNPQLSRRVSSGGQVRRE